MNQKDSEGLNNLKTGEVAALCLLLQGSYGPLA